LEDSAFIRDEIGEDGELLPRDLGELGKGELHLPLLELSELLLPALRLRFFVCIMLCCKLSVCLRCIVMKKTHNVL